MVLAFLSCALFMVVLLSGLVPFQHFPGIVATTAGAAAASHRKGTGCSEATAAS